MEHRIHSPESPRPNRRQFLLTSGSTVAAGVIAHSGRLINEFTSPQPYKKESKMKGTKPSIVFCHGLWADGSCFSKVMPALQAEGHEVIAAQYSLNTTADDVATVRRTPRPGQQPCHPRRPLLWRKRHYRRRNRRPRCRAGLHRCTCSRRRRDVTDATVQLP